MHLLQNECVNPTEGVEVIFKFWSEKVFTQNK